MRTQLGDASMAEEERARADAMCDSVLYLIERHTIGYPFVIWKQKYTYVRTYTWLCNPEEPGRVRPRLGSLLRILG